MLGFSSKKLLRLLFAVFLLLPAPCAFSMSFTYIRPEENYDSDVMLRKYGQRPDGDVSFSEFVYNKIEANSIPKNVYIHFAGMGKEIYQLYGHTGIVLEYESGERIFFDWGNFNSNKPGFVSDFIHGNLIYTLSVHTIDFWESYLESEGRTSRFYKLLMTDSQKIDLQNFLYYNSRPENLNYLYDFFKDNCSTRVRDVLNRAYDGKLFDFFSKIPQGTYRRVIERAVRNMSSVEFIYNFGQGPSQDAPISYYDAMFLPGYLEAGLKRFMIDRSVCAGKGEKLIYRALSDSMSFASGVCAARVNGYFPSSIDPNDIRKHVSVHVVSGIKEGNYDILYPEAVVEGENLPPRKTTMFLVLAVLFFINFLDFIMPNKAGSVFRVISLSIACVIEIVMGVLSLALIYFSSFTIHTFVYFNCNLIFVNPFMFVAAYYSFRLIFEDRYELKYMRCNALLLLMCLAATILKLSYRQENFYLIVAFYVYFSSLIAVMFCKNADYSIDLRRWFKKKVFRFR